MGVLDDVVADLNAEGEELEAFVAGLDPADWQRPTPSPRWVVADQIAHLAWTDSVALVAMTDPDAFAALKRGGGAVEDPRQTAAREPSELLLHWSSGRSRVVEALFEVPPGTKIPWFGPPMSPASMATARLMETWAHGTDVRATFGVDRAASSRLRHVAHIGVITRNFAYATNGEEVPTAEVLVALDGPDGAQWTWGPADADQSVRGPALDFCLVVTRRRHPDDVSLRIEGPDARRWMEIAQAFARPPGPLPERT